MTQPIAGYPPHTPEKVDRVNQNKEMEERLLRVCESLLRTGKTDVDHRWVAIAKTHFEQGFMALNRAIFQPTRISLPEDQPPAQPPTPAP